MAKIKLGPVATRLRAEGFKIVAGGFIPNPINAPKGAVVANFIRGSGKKQDEASIVLNPNTGREYRSVILYANKKESKWQAKVTSK